MKKIIGFLNTGMPGCSVAEAYLVPDDADDAYISDMVWEESCTWAGHYMDVVSDSEVGDLNPDDEGTDWINASDIDCYWEVYNGDEHDGERTGGGSFEKDFERLAQ
jgi:hypothetical protein